MGYAGVEDLNYASAVGYEQVADSMPITFHNPDCNLETTPTMQDCGLRPDIQYCDHTEDVYIKCAGKLHK